MSHNWTYDADTGVHKNHYIGNKLLKRSLGATKVAQFTKPFPGVGQTVKNKGETVNIMHMNEMPDSASDQLTEDTRIPVDKTTIDNRQVTLVEWGRGLEYSNLTEQLSKFKPSSYLQSGLIRHMTNSIDTAAAAAFKTTDVKICFIPTSLTGGTFDTDGTPSTTATANITFDHMGVLADYLAGDIHAPPYEGDDYIYLATRKSLRGLKQDTLWQQVHMYLQKGDLFFRGEQGKAENIRSVQVDRELAFSNTAGSSTVLGDGVVFGDEAVGYAEAQPPELRANPNYQADFGRSKAVAWYGIYVFASVWDSASDGKAKIIRVTSG